jgi:hypothetical protein
VTTARHRRTRDLAADAYLVSRALGDVDAAQHHRLIKRLVKRQYHRGLINLLRRGRLL